MFDLRIPSLFFAAFCACDPWTEGLGRKLADLPAGPTELIWSAGGEEILVLSSGGDRNNVLLAVSVAGGAIRTVDDRGGYRWSLSAAPGAAFYLYNPSLDEASLVRASLASTGAFETITATAGAYVVSRDGTKVAYKLRDADLLTLNEAGVEHALGSGTPITFSPDDGKVLCAPGGGVVPGRFFAVDTITAASEPMQFDLGGAEYLGLRWDEAGVRILLRRQLFEDSSDDDRIDLIEVRQHGRSAPLATWEQPKDEGVMTAGLPLLSRDRIFAWSSECRGWEGILWDRSCVRARVTLHAVDFSGREVELVRAEVENSRRAGIFAAFSDGKRVGYTLGGELYVAELD